MSMKQSLTSDCGKGELVKTSTNAGKKIAVSEAAKTKSALKSHSDAERRRRDRINAHLDTLRGLLPNKEKMDKATLLAQVITELNRLTKTARQASENHNLPMDTDKVHVIKLENKARVGNVGAFLIRASLSCEYNDGLLSNIDDAINNLPVQLLKSEISTLGCRVKAVFIATTTGNGNGAPEDVILNSVRAALNNILDKASASVEYAQQLMRPQKRPRISFLNSMCPWS